MFQSQQTDHASDELFPEFPEEQRREAIDNLHQYFEVIYRIYEEQEAEGNLDKLIEEFSLRKDWQKRFNKPNNVSQNLGRPIDTSHEKRHGKTLDT